jgi:lipopolysaccharide transport system permease protein
VKYKQTFLGMAWVILQPFILMVVFTLFFSNLMGVPSDGIPYPIFAYSGLMLWYIFASGVNTAGNSMVTHANMIKKIYFPRLIIPIAAVMVSLFDFIMAFLVYIGILIYYQYPVNIGQIVLFLPLAILVALVATAGIGSLLGALNVKYRDFRYIITFLIQVLFFLTPIIYPISIIKEPWGQKLLAINPMTGAIDLARAALIDKPVNWELIGISMISATLFLIIGLVFFRRTEAFFADVA